MNNISNIHKSFSFTIIVIISTFVGIIMSLHYSNAKYNYFFTDSFENVIDTSEKIYSQEQFKVLLLFFENQTTMWKKKPLWVLNLLLSQVSSAYEM